VDFVMASDSRMRVFTANIARFDTHFRPSCIGSYSSHFSIDCDTAGVKL
jgi:hypothetical protein